MSDTSMQRDGEFAAEREAVSRLKELAEEYRGTEVGALYQRQWEAAGGRNPQYQYWKHNKSGETFAVMVANDTEVQGVTGPLHYTDVTQAHLDEADFDFDFEDVGWIQKHHEEFNVLEGDLPGDLAAA